MAQPRIALKQAKGSVVLLYRSRKRKLTALVLVFILGILVLSPLLGPLASFPNELRMFHGRDKTLNLHVPAHAHVEMDRPGVVRVNGQTRPSFDIDLNQPIKLQSEGLGTAQMRLKLFGRIPLKELKVDVIPDLKVIPGGQTIGVKLKSKGILVVGHHLVDNGKDRVSPGQEAGIKRGDWITHMNGVQLEDISQVSEWVERAGKNHDSLELSIRRNGKPLKLKIRPVLDEDEQTYRMGLYIRDTAAGVGTLTFYAPDQKVYGALGHRITDLDTHTPMTVKSGEIVQSNVTSISKSRSGRPGEKRAHFFSTGKVLGNIEKNSSFGIYGTMTRFPEPSRDKIPVALSDEVKVGPAKILTVVNGQKVEEFDIEIVHVARQNEPATKGMVIKVVDRRLLDETGGIVQGMSGSPILQNGKLVGAVTHVFVNDPSSGYGCFIEWMLQESGLLLRETWTEKAS